VRNLEEFVVLLHKIDNEVDVEKFKVNGVDYWPLVRTSLWMNYREHYLAKDKKNVRKVKNDFSKKLVTFIRSFFCGHLFYLFKKRRLIKADLFFFGDISSLRVPFGDKSTYRDAFFDPLIMELSQYWSVFTIRQNFAFVRPVRGEFDYEVIGLDFLLHSIKALFVTEKGRLTMEFKSELDKIRTNYPVLVDFVPSLKYLSRHISMSRSFTNLMEEYLWIIDPKMVFLTHYNSHLATSLIYAAKKLGIPVFDVQHGVINNLHPSYSFVNRKIYGLNSIPDAFLIKDVFSYKVLINWIPANKIYLLPNELQASVLGSFAGLGKDFLESLQSSIKGRKLILFTLSWENGINDLLEEIVNSSRDIAFFIFRLHPSTPLWEEKIIRKLISNIIPEDHYRIHSAKEIPLNVLLELVDLHITECSSVVIDALQFGKKSVIISKIGLEYYKELIASGHIIFTESVTEIIELLYNNKLYYNRPRLSFVNDFQSPQLSLNNFICDVALVER
jgi:hypothetical protein